MLRKSPSAGDDDHVEFGAGHFDAHGDGEGAAVDAMEAVGLLAFQEVDEVAATADAGDDDVVLDGQAGFLQAIDHSEFKGAADAEVAAAGAPLEVVFRVFFTHARATSSGRGYWW